MSNAQQVNSSNFGTEVLKATGVVMVDFWAAWCGPCRMLTPIVDELSVEYAGKAKIVGLDVDKATDIATTYQVQAIPTILFFKNGLVVEQVIGVQPKDALKAKLDKYIN